MYLQKSFSLPLHVPHKVELQVAFGFSNTTWVCSGSVSAFPQAVCPCFHLWWTLCVFGMSYEHTVYPC